MKTPTAYTATAMLLCGLMTGCETMPGDRKTQGAVIGGAAGAAAGAAVGGKNRMLGAIIGGVLGAGGGYVIASKTDRPNEESIRTADRRSKDEPASVEAASNATTADLNNDGFVTMDEIVAMKKAGFSDDAMVDRMRATGQIFELTAEQRRYLQEQGVSRRVLDEMMRMNQHAEAVTNERRDVISR